MGLDKWAPVLGKSTKYSNHSIAYGNNQFVVVGPGTIFTSQDEGATWVGNPSVVAQPGWASLYSVAYGDGVFVAVGGHRSRWNGFNWSPPISQTVSGITTFLRAIAHGKDALGAGLFVAVGDAGTIVTSPDGVTWTSVNSGTTGDLRAIAYGNSRFVAAAESGSILTSPNGATWTTHLQTTTSLTSLLRTLAFGNNSFVAVDNNQFVRTSSDGTSWVNLSTVLATADLSVSIGYGFDTFVVVGDKGSIHTSPDGVIWTKQSSGSSDYFMAVAYGMNRFVAVDTTGAILRSGEFPSADLKALSSNAWPLNPTFNPLVIAYSANVVGDVASVTPTSEDALATIRVRLGSGSDVVVPSGTKSADGQMSFFVPNTFFIMVTARNNTTKVYTLDVYRAWVIQLVVRVYRGLRRFWFFR
jgi:hypothetical protein